MYMGPGTGNIRGTIFEKTKQSKGENKGYTEGLENRCIAVEFVTNCCLPGEYFYLQKCGDGCV